MRFSVLIPLSITSLLFGGVFMAKSADETPAPSSWNQEAAAHYLDSRQGWWEGWSEIAARSWDCLCLLPHRSPLMHLLAAGIAHRSGRTLPYEYRTSDACQCDQTRHTLKGGRTCLYRCQARASQVSRGARHRVGSNALVLANYNAQQGHLKDITRQAFDAAWALQLKTGDNAGAWTWLNFHNSPWEADESQYFGATLAAIAVGVAPDHYAKDHQIQANLKLLRSYLRSQYQTQPLINQVVLLVGASHRSRGFSKRTKALRADGGTVRPSRSTGDGASRPWAHSSARTKTAEIREVTDTLPG